MWVEAGFQPETFWRQTQRSFSNALAGVARRSITEAWQIAALSGSAYAGKLKALSEYLPAEQGEITPGSNRILGHLFKLKRRGIPMTIEKIERLH